MMKLHSDKSRAVSNMKKAASIWMPAFFLCTAISVQAQSNTVLGTAFGTNANVTTFSSVSDGFGYLTIGAPNSTAVILSNNVSGTIGIENNFDTFTITGTGGTITSATNMLAPALNVVGGTNLHITGGSFKGSGGLGSIDLPPLPGGGTQFLLSSNATDGASIQNVQNAQISQARFEGTTYAPSTTFTLGTDGMEANNSGLLFADDGTNSSALVGGDGADIHSDSANTFSLGGGGLYAENGSSLVVSNGTFLGGLGGEASATAGSTSDSRGGNAILLENSTATIFDGTFSGGGSGPASTSIGGSGLYASGSTNVTIMGGTFQGGNSGTGDISKAGHGIYATNATVNIHGGLLAGGSTASATMALGGSGLFAVDSVVMIEGTNTTLNGGDGAAGFTAINSDVAINDGTFTGGTTGTGDYYGFISAVETGGANNVTLNGGTFSSISFDGSGTQFLTMGTNVVIQDFLVVDDGTVGVNNISTTAFHNVFVRDGNMVFSNDFAMGSGDAFTLLTPSSLAAFPNLTVGLDSTLYVGQGQIEATGDVRISEGGTAAFEITDSSVSKIIADTATFETNSTLSVNAEAAIFTPGTNDLNIVETTSGILVANGGGTTNATTTTFNDHVDVVGFTDWLTTLDGAYVDGGDTLRLRFIAGTWGSAWNPGTPEATLGDELQSLDDGTMASAVNSMSEDQFIATTETTYFTTFNTFGTILQGMQAAVGQTTSRGTEFREQLKLMPQGTRGPERNNKVRGWGKYYGQFYDRDEQGPNPEYDAYLHGGVIGIDTSIENLLIGISGGAGGSRINFESDAMEDITSYHGSLYSTYGWSRAYIDCGIAYGHSDVTTETADPFKLEGEFDAQLISGYLGAGYNLIDGAGGMVFTPEASVQYSSYKQDAYEEMSTVAVPRSFDEFDADSIRSSLGLNVAMLNTKKFKTFGVKVEGRFHWIHEFNPEPGDVDFMLVGGSTGYQLEHPMLDEDLYRVGLSMTFFNTLRQKPKNVLFRIDIDELFGEDFMSHNVAGKVVYAF